MQPHAHSDFHKFGVMPTSYQDARRMHNASVFSSCLVARASTVSACGLAPCCFRATFEVTLTAPTSDSTTKLASSFAIHVRGQALAPRQEEMSAPDLETGRRADQDAGEQTNNLSWDLCGRALGHRGAGSHVTRADGLALGYLLRDRPKFYEVTLLCMLRVALADPGQVIAETG